MSVDPKLVRDLFLAVSELPVVERAAYLQTHAPSNAELHAAVERLLAAHEQPASLLNQPAPGMPTAEYPGIHERTGTMIGPYKLMEQIGEGGFGLVFVAEQTEPVKRKVALKIIKPGMDSQQVIARFEAERQALAMMDHPNIAKVLDAGITSERRDVSPPVNAHDNQRAYAAPLTGGPYFVMELVRGIPITDYCDQNHLTPTERLELFISVCHAIQHAHQKGIIHRDIKPSNVLVTSHDGKPVAKVIDFGVAKAIHQSLTDRTIYTQFAQMIGTPLYMSPEQAEMSGLDIDTRSDIYSLGVLLYELLTGSTPLERDKLAKAAYDEIRRAIREDDPQRPSDRLSTSATLPSLAASRKTEPTRLSRMLKGELDWIVMKALDKDRSRRYETANGFAKDIQQYLSDGVVEARPMSTVYLFQKFVKRHQGQVIAASLVLVALLAGIVGTTLGLIDAKKQRQLAVAAEQAAAERAEGERQAKEKAVHEAEKARKQTEIAEAVREFLEHDLIAQADPNQPGKDEGKSKDVELKLKTALDRAVPLIGKRFEGKPLIEASIRRAIGKAYEGRGLYAEALVQNEKACELYRAELAVTKEADFEGVVLGPYFEAQMQLITLYNMQGHKQKALTTIQQLEDQVKRSFGDKAEGKAILEPVALLRDIVEGKKDPVQAFKKSQEVFANSGTEMKEVGEAVKPSLDAMNTFFELKKLVDQGKYAEAELALTQQLKLEQGKGESNMSFLFLVALAEVHKNQGKFAEAEHTLEQVIETLPAKGDSQLLFSSMLGLAELYRIQGKHAQARAKYESARDGIKKALGEDHPFLGGCHQGLAQVWLAEKKYTEAEIEIRIAQAFYERNVFMFKYAGFEAKSILGAILSGQKKYNEAEPLLLAGYHGLQQHEKTLPEIRKTLLPEALDRLIQLYTETKMPDEVKKWQAERAKLPQAVEKKP